eukprot:SAG11_NODE_6165_length_1373_cov_1.285714_1_plen_410_part_10
MKRGVSADMPKAFDSAKFMKDAKDSPQRHLHGLGWSPDGRVLAVPYGRCDVILLAAGSWKEVGRLKGGANGGHTEDVSLVAWSPSGRYVASGDTNGRIVFWDAAKGHVIDSRTIADGVPLTSLSWDPSRNSLVAANAAGTVIKPWVDVIPPEYPAPFATLASIFDEEDAEEELAKAPKAPAQSPRKGGSLLEDEAEDAGSDEEKEGGGGGGGGEASEDEVAALGADGGGELYGGEGAADKFSHVLKAIEQRAKANEAEAEKFGGADEDSYYERRGPPEAPAQEPFSSGATPLEDGRRQLAWNLVGRVTSVERRDHSSLEIEFEDTTRHRRPVNFQDNTRYTMADLSDIGAIFGAPSRGMTPSRLHFRFFDDWDRGSWLCELEEVRPRNMVIASNARSPPRFARSAVSVCR